MRKKFVLSFVLLVLLAFPAAGFANYNWVIISPMAFSSDDSTGSSLIYKVDTNNEAYLTIGTNYGHVWAPVNFPPTATLKQVTRLDARMYDNLDALNPTQTMDWGWLGVQLIKLNFATGQTEVVAGVGTAFQGAPGLVTKSSIPFGNPVINNKKFAWFLRFTVELVSYPDHDLRLYAVRIAYQ